MEGSKVNQFNQWHHSSSWNLEGFFYFYFFITRHTGWLFLFPSSVVVFVNIYVHHWLPRLVLITCCCGNSVWVASRHQLGVGGVGGAVATGDGHCWGSSDGCFLVFRVSMRDWTPRFTLVVTRRVTESGEGAEEEPARWEGGRATRHFWYRSWGRKKRVRRKNI